jgi:peptide deformylase
VTRRIHIYPNPILKEVCTLVENFDKSLISLSDDLGKYALRLGALGMAAPQLGEPIRVICLIINGMPEIFVNPTLRVEDEETVSSREGCLSIPDVRLNLKIRHRSVHVVGHDQFGEEREMTLSGVEAIGCEHELNHLDGITILDHCSKAQYTLAMLKVRKYRKKLSREPIYKQGKSLFAL